jgi:(1->4)-alpha-D-glucan 1-alpha-D-glucosylmutase
VDDFIASYRLQLGPDLNFEQAKELVPYLEALGVSHLYLSPIWSARKGSTHGYDVIDPARIAFELGGDRGFRELAATGLGLILDVVPNHMAADPANRFWSDDTLRSQVFDIDKAHGFQRRFFDVDDLVGVRVEDPDVFEMTQHRAIELVAEGLAIGLRIDHVDGLADPAGYLERLAKRGVAHIWVEKILQADEELPQWPVEGTTGYDALNALTALFVDPSAEAVLTGLSREPRPFSEIAHEAKLEQADTTFAPEVRELHDLVDEPNLVEALASLPVYRTYVRAGFAPSDADLRALASLPKSMAKHFDGGSDEFVVRFQQTTGAVMAKGVEDTAFYRYVRLLALNEVGGDPSRFGLSVAEFHAQNLRRLAEHPRSMLASQTHDTKRSGDVRARLIALTRNTEEWVRAVSAWHELGLEHRQGAMPDWGEELFIFQTLVGAWPISSDRLEGYLRKALREAKRNSSWLAPDEAWEAGVIAYCKDLCADDRFLASFTPFSERIAFVGEQIALGELALRLTCPGMPGIYQGDENWDIALVDPDNRRPVDWAAARARLTALREGASVLRESAKLFVTTELLHLRRVNSVAFATKYQPIEAGPTTCAYYRGSDVMVVSGLRTGSTSVDAPGPEWRNVLQPLSVPYPDLLLSVFVRG